MTDLFDEAIAVADAVLYEGYLLYPYRASSGKNRIRFQFGVLVPPGAASAVAEHPTCVTECLCEPSTDDRLTLRVRFLHHRSRTVEQAAEDGTFGEVDRMSTESGDEIIGWDEAVERQVEVTVPVPAEETVLRFSVPGSREVEEVPGGRIVRTCRPVVGEVRCRARRIDGPYGGTRLSVIVANTTPSSAGTRDEVLPYALIGTHTLLALDHGRFLSLSDPPEWAMPAAAECVNERSWPVLINEHVVLASPIILDDHPKIAPESPGSLFDGTEIDEILTLRTLTLTDEEKREVRATDEHARALLDRVEGMPPELLDRLHGTIRYLREAAAESPTPPPETPWWDPTTDVAASEPVEESVNVLGVRLTKGSRVRLAPHPTGTDAQDMFVAGRTATVEDVLSDVEGRQYVAVLLDEEAAAGGDAYGRFRYFDPAELIPIETPTEAPSDPAPTDRPRHLKERA